MQDGHSCTSFRASTDGYEGRGIYYVRMSIGLTTHAGCWSPSFANAVAKVSQLYGWRPQISIIARWDIQRNSDVVVARCLRQQRAVRCYLVNHLEQEMHATVTVATADSASTSKATANFVGDGTNDQVVINNAINSLPPCGGCVLLHEGNYDIRASDAITGIRLDRSNVILQGMGLATKLYLGTGQNVNVIRIIGNGIENVTIRDLYIHGNRAQNYGSNFECCGVRAVTSGNKPCSNITVENCRIEECHRLNVMLFGDGVYVRNCHFGDASSDSVELLGGPGEISGNYLQVSGETGYGLGSDAADTIRINNNTVRVKSTGKVTEAIFRTWGGRYRNLLEGNLVIVEPGGWVKRIFETRGYLNVISNNSITGHAPNAAKNIERGLVEVNGGTLISSNYFTHIDVAVQDTSGGWPTSIVSNYFFYSAVTVKPNNTMMWGNVWFPA